MLSCIVLGDMYLYQTEQTISEVCKDKKKAKMMNINMNSEKTLRINDDVIEKVAKI